MTRASCQQSVTPQAYTAPADCPPTDFFNAGNLSCASCGSNSAQQQTQSGMSVLRVHLSTPVCRLVCTLASWVARPQVSLSVAMVTCIPAVVSCVCSPGYIKSTTTNTCVSCSNNQVAIASFSFLLWSSISLQLQAVSSRDGLFCLQCLPPLMFDSTTMSCTGCDFTGYYSTYATDLIELCECDSYTHWLTLQ